MSGEKGTDELHKRRPHLDLSTTRYSRVLDAIEKEIKKERNETYETFQLLARKQHIGESLEQFHSVLSGLDTRGQRYPRRCTVLRCHMNVDLSMLNHMDRQPGEQQPAAPPVELERFR